MPLWQGRFSQELDDIAALLNNSLPIDCRLWMDDIAGSVAHAAMLGECGIISKSESEKIIAGLEGIKRDLETGKLALGSDLDYEDIHSFVEGELTKRIGPAGGRLHTARSRNDQVATDLRLFLRRACDDLTSQLRELTATLAHRARECAVMVCPGYTHLQRAQPITFGHHLLAYAEMFIRDIGRVEDAQKRMNQSPLGCGALAGTTYPIDRRMTAEALGFDGFTKNSLDGVSDRDFCIELAAALSIIMVHLSRFSEEIILWCSWEFKFVELTDAFSTGSSIMPQKKNPDIAELCRGKSGRVFGDLMGLLSLMKGLPLAYNKDMQEDKEAIFDALDTVSLCLSAFTPMIDGMRPIPENMRAAAAKGFINATDCADYLTKKGIPFREAYKATGEIVARCIELGETLETLPLEEYKKYHEAFDGGVYDVINLAVCVQERRSAGAASGCAERAQEILNEMKLNI